MLPVRGTARFLCAGAAGGRHRCRCSVRGCRPSPLAAVVAVVVVAGSWWLVPCATYRLPRSFAGRFRRQRRGLLLVPARPGGLGKFLRRASPSFLGRARVGCPGCGLAVVLHRVAVSRAPAQFSNTQDKEPAPATPATSLPQPPPEKKAPWKLRQNRCRRCRAAPGVAGGCPGGPSEAAVPAGTDASPPAPPAVCSLVWLASCKIHLPRAQPYVHRAKLNTTALLAGNAKRIV